MDSRTSKAMIKEGPHIERSCRGCHWHKSERYQVQGDSGYDHYCTHGGMKRDTGSFTGKTPEWCPFTQSSPEPPAVNGVKLDRLRYEGVEYVPWDKFVEQVQKLQTENKSLRASQPPAPVAPTWTCPNCETADEFTVTHHGPDDLGAVYPVMICRICDTTVSDYRAEQIRAICQNNPAVRLAPTKEVR